MDSNGKQHFNQRQTSDGRKGNRPPNRFEMEKSVENKSRLKNEDLSDKELLKKCLGGFTQNNNESFNALVWKFAIYITYIILI